MKKILEKKKIKQLILKRNTVSCLIATHIFGISCNMIELLKLCKNYNIKLIEDASESLGSKHRNKHLGTYGDVGILSFNGNKIITTRVQGEH